MNHHWLTYVHYLKQKNKQFVQPLLRRFSYITFEEIDHQRCYTYGQSTDTLRLFGTLGEFDTAVEQHISNKMTRKTITSFGTLTGAVSEERDKRERNKLKGGQKYYAKTGTSEWETFIESQMIKRPARGTIKQLNKSRVTTKSMLDLWTREQYRDGRKLIGSVRH